MYNIYKWTNFVNSWTYLQANCCTTNIKGWMKDGDCTFICLNNGVSRIFYMNFEIKFIVIV